MSIASGARRTSHRRRGTVTSWSSLATWAGIVALTFVCAPGRPNAQVLSANALAQSHRPLVGPDERVSTKWSFFASADTYLVPDDRDYLQPTVAADRGKLHVEARYNYEAPDTGSVWLGRNFRGSRRVAWEFTPMLGGVFGDTTGVAPGYRMSWDWSVLELRSEGEYVFDTADSSSSFMYNASQLTLAPVDWLRLGVAMQRTRAYETGLDIQRGFIAEVSHGRLSFATYVFNLGWTDPTVVLAMGVEFQARCSLSHRRSGRRKRERHDGHAGDLGTAGHCTPPGTR